MSKRLGSNPQRLYSWSCTAALLALLVSLPPAHAFAAENGPNVQGPQKLQALLDAAAPGSVVRLPEGRYEGPLVVRKPVQIEPEADAGVTLVAPKDGSEAVLRVETDGAQITGLSIEDSRDDPDTVAVQVLGSRNELSKLHIRSMGYGIRLKGASQNRLTGNTVDGLTESESKGAQETEPGERGNGIDLLESDENVLTGNTISNMFDGIYIEKGKANRVERNQVTDSRYGYHLMFDKDTVIQNNVGSRNVTGAMVMSDEGAWVLGNDFAKQSENATAQGILLFDVKGVRVEQNRMEGNRLGLYAQGITNTEIRSNRFLRNFVGIQLAGAESSAIQGNAFVGNVVQALAEAGKNNAIAWNYWDDHSGLDLQGDGASDLVYRSNPFFMRLTDQMPGYQLFFGAPGLQLLETLFPSEDEEAFKDLSPLLHLPDELPAEAGGSSAGWLSALFSAALLAGGAGLFIWGGRRT